MFTPGYKLTFRIPPPPPPLPSKQTIMMFSVTPTTQEMLFSCQLFPHYLHLPRPAPGYQSGGTGRQVP